MRDFRKIESWQLADDLAVAVYEATKSFPKEELYGVTSQIRRSATSVAANIVEGASRESAKDYAHFLQIARGSLAETQYFIHLARRLRYLSDLDADQLEQMARRVFGCLHGLSTAVRSSSSRKSH
jgi:four helix bundle protein